MGLSTRRIIDLSDYRPVRLSSCWTIDPSDYQAFKLSICTLCKLVTIIYCSHFCQNHAQTISHGTKHSWTNVGGGTEICSNDDKNQLHEYLCVKLYMYKWSGLTLKISLDFNIMFDKAEYWTLYIVYESYLPPMKVWEVLLSENWWKMRKKLKMRKKNVPPENFLKW